MERVLAIQADCLADDIPVFPQMAAWTDAQLIAFFESGGVEAPPSADPPPDMREHLLSQLAAGTYSDAAALESARSSADGWEAHGREALEAHEDVVGEDMLGEELLEDALDVDGDERLEAATLDAPMASVRVTPAPPRATAAEEEERVEEEEREKEEKVEVEKAKEKEEEEDGVAGWSVRQLKEFLHARGVDTSPFSEKRELIAEARRQQAAAAAAAAAPPPPPSAAAARLLRKLEEIKRSGDEAYRAKDMPKAERHYSSALSRAAEAEAPLPAVLLAALFSNRSGTRMMLNRHEEALQDGRMALKHRPAWARAYSRVGAALVALRRLDEAKAVYEEGLRHAAGAAELHDGLADVLGRMGAGAGSSEEAKAAKDKGNAFFKEGKLEEAYSAYSAAIRCAPKDEALYSNRSATLARLERFDEALADAKRAVALQPSWGKAYSRAGLAALKGGDEEAAYWFYANGLLRDPSNRELINGRDSTLQALFSVQSQRNRKRVERFKRDASRPAARIFAVSDVHYDHPGAKEWAAGLSKTAYKDDAIIVAGDVGDTYTAVKYCLKAFRACFRRVFYVPGNHDMWIRPKGQHSDEPSMFADSVQKLLSLWQLCDELDVDTGPVQLSSKVTVVPLDAWYHFSFDHHDPRPGSTKFDKWCKWPMHYDSVWEFMTGLNDARIEIAQKYASPPLGDGMHVITFSHFLPRKELPLPGVYEMAKASGCLRTEEQLRRLKSKCHIFGHTHINTQSEYDGVTYMQNAMGYGIAPGTKLCVIHDGGKFKSYMA